MPERPYTPDTLAARWQCSAETVRNLIKQGKLEGFRLGRMFRIPAQAVEEYEQCLISPLADCGAVSASRGTKAVNVDAISLRHAPERKPRPKR
ncbi:helix-turn-helix domain-containing protein [Pseudorhodobacter sp. E13]|uniref:helix-turn-helix domain-containing protein n=1 Tax=Pseudorhodobacter sp. E13 TaxID=2487931 RepID=UPI000F8E8EC4